MSDIIVAIFFIATIVGLKKPIYGSIAGLVVSIGYCYFGKNVGLSSWILIPMFCALFGFVFPLSVRWLFSGLRGGRGKTELGTTYIGGFGVGRAGQFFGKWSEGLPYIVRVVITDRIKHHENGAVLINLARRAHPQLFFVNLKYLVVRKFQIGWSCSTVLNWKYIHKDTSTRSPLCWSGPSNTVHVTANPFRKIGLIGRVHGSGIGMQLHPVAHLPGRSSSSSFSCHCKYLPRPCPEGPRKSSKRNLLSEKK